MATVTSGFDEAVWNYGAKSATDYPFLLGIESFRPGLQAALFADFQTQILPLIGEATLSVGGRTAMRQDESVNLILDTNGRGGRRADACSVMRSRGDDGENELQQCDGAIARDRCRFGGVYG